MRLPNKVYDVIKWVVIYVMPAALVFINTCFPVWGINDDITKVVITTVSALELFLGSIMGFSSAAYNKSKQEGANANE